MSADGFIAGPDGEMDWMVWNWDDNLKKYEFELTKAVGTILLGHDRWLCFIWLDVMTKPDDPSSVGRSIACICEKDDRNTKGC